MRLPALARAAVVVAAASTGLACSIEVPVDLALVGEDNVISIFLPNIPPPQGVITTELTGYARTTMTVNLFGLDGFGDIPATITIDDLLIAGTEVQIFGGLINLGNACVTQDPDLLGGGMALVRAFSEEVDLYLELDTLVQVTDTEVADFLGLEPLPFGAVIDQQAIPLALTDLIGLFLGTGGSGLEITQTLIDVLPDDIPIIGGGVIAAELTLASTDTLPTSDTLETCLAFLEGP